MKDLIRFLLLFLLCGLLWDKIVTAKEDTAPPKPHRRPTLEAPLIPEFTLHHPEPGFFEGILNNFDAEHNLGEKILIACQIDGIRPVSVELIAPENADLPLNLGQLCDLYQAAQTWQYLNDPAGREYFAPPAESHRTHRGDCDDYAIYLASLASSIGFESVIGVGFDVSGQCHAFPEVCLGPMDAEIVEKYVRDRFELDSRQPVGIRKDSLQHLYLNLDRGQYPGAKPFRGKLILRLFLTDHSIEQF